MQPDPYFLKTNRLGCRHWSEDDLPLALGLWGDPDVTRYIGGPFSPEQVAARLKLEIDRQGNYGIQYWPIFLLSTDEHVGCAGLRPHKELIPELGFHLRRAFWGQGLAEEAARAVIEFAFRSLGAKSIFAAHDPKNAASCHVLQKLGFCYTHHELYPPTGEMHPSYLLQP
ncbi:MAG TPA: GNAT family N-acetyltransferase [Terriglobales bacterium]|nr:GNAT family N-acetyltransferase [Terriglobales bacterium]